MFHRLLGGLLSSYDLTGDMMFLHKAEQLAEQLMPAWDSPSGIPYNKINMQSGHTSNSDWAGVLLDSRPYVCMRSLLSNAVIFFITFPSINCYLLLFKYQFFCWFSCILKQSRREPILVRQQYTLE